MNVFLQFEKLALCALNNEFIMILFTLSALKIAAFKTNKISLMTTSEAAQAVLIQTIKPELKYKGLLIMSGGMIVLTWVHM